MNLIAQSIAHANAAYFGVHADNFLPVEQPIGPQVIDRDSPLYKRLCTKPVEFHDFRDGQPADKWATEPRHDMNLRGRDLS